MKDIFIKLAKEIARVCVATFASYLGLVCTGCVAIH